MKSACLLAALLSALLNCATSVSVNPIGKVLELLSKLEQKILKEGETDQKTYTEFANFCQVTSSELRYEIKNEKQEVSNLKATIDKATSDISVYSETIDTQAAAVSANEAELKSATELRAKENKDFKDTEKELIMAKDTMDRAIAILSREMDKGASLVQMKGARGVAQALSAVVEASSISSADAAALTALVQSSVSSDDADEDGDGELGAPAATTYETHSESVLDLLNGLLEKSSATYDKLLKDETNAAHAYELAKQAIEAKIQSAKDELADAKKDKAAAEEAKAIAEGDLTVTEKDLGADIAALEKGHFSCMEKASNFEEEMKSRGQELKALAEAKKVIQEQTGGAEKQTYDLAQVSFLQVKAKAKSQSSQASQVLHLVRKLARTHHSGALLQLASRIDVAIRSMARSGTSDEQDPFAKVKDLIEEMISRLTQEASADASQKAFCDKETAENTQKKETKEADLEQLSASIASMTMKSQSLQSEVATLQKEIAGYAKGQAEMTRLRQEEKAHYDTNKPEMEAGLEGVKMALKLLRDYYGGQVDMAHEAAEGTAESIISLLEVCESDFEKGLAEMIATEESAVEEYEKDTKGLSWISRAKSQDVKYKTKEYTALDKAVAETTSDKEGVSEELAAVKSYLKSLDSQCVARPETYEERSKRRGQEIAGLKEALEILQATALVQVRSTARHALRGVALQH